MPRVCLTREARERAADQDADQALQEAVIIHLHRTRIQRQELAKLLGMSAPTLRRKMDDPGLLTMGELRKIIRFLGITETEKRKFI